MRTGAAVWLGGRIRQLVQGIEEKIRSGATNIEICAPGADRSETSFGSVGQEQREAVQEIAKAHPEITWSVHSTIETMGGSGATRSGFSDAQRAEIIKEHKRAIDFASNL